MTNANFENRKIRVNTNRLGFWSAILTAFFAAIFLGMGLFGSTYTEKITYPYVLTTIRPIDYALWYPAVFLALGIIILFTCIHHQISTDKKVFTQIALAFGLIYAVLTVTDFFIQWTVVLPSILSNETADLSLISLYNPHGIPIAIECLGYLMLDSALLFLAPVFSGREKIERSLRWLSVVVFVFTIGSFGALSLSGNPIVVFEVVAVTVNVVVLIAMGALLSLFFKQQARTSAQADASCAGKSAAV